MKREVSSALKGDRMLYLALTCFIIPCVYTKFYLCFVFVISCAYTVRIKTFIYEYILVVLECFIGL